MQVRKCSHKHTAGNRLYFCDSAGTS